ncbi:uncharacterized protein LOC108482665 [Gossypium arboreum]|uniref:Uncharacterized protein n=1 Tax=Gossypium arboreum TaxID=29729 RepID=A0ABR0R1Y6_GOSAR|nr:uncharacterized protein LOC108482665 [Gossypium arboreum]KAK5845610.1 hypothetical protein PVK06_001804 [Gossypium arboreum]
MSRRIIVRTPTTGSRRQPLLQSRSTSSSLSMVDDGSRYSRNSSSRKSAKFGELCGGTAAECAAVCCCCPCGIANLLVLVVYKVPAGLCRRALRQKRRKKLQKKGLFQPRNYGSRYGCEERELRNHPMVCAKELMVEMEVSEEADKALFQLEEEMWERFHGTGFWRSPSQRERDSSTIN